MKAGLTANFQKSKILKKERLTENKLNYSNMVKITNKKKWDREGFISRSEKVGLIKSIFCELWSEKNNSKKEDEETSFQSY